MVAVLGSDLYVLEVNIVGDCVWAVYKTPKTTDIDDVFTIAARANTLINLVNKKMEKKGYTDTLRIGIGVDYGRVLMIKAGYSGSGINDIVYMGDVVNRAAHLAHSAGRNTFFAQDPIWVGEIFAQNLNEENKKLLESKFSYELGNYRTGYVILTEMNEWIDSL